MAGVDLWMHGQAHDSFGYWVEACRVVANSAGYVLKCFVEVKDARF